MKKQKNVNALQKHKMSDKIKWIIAFSLIFVVLAGTVAIAVTLFDNTENNPVVVEDDNLIDVVIDYSPASGTKKVTGLYISSVDLYKGIKEKGYYELRLNVVDVEEPLTWEFMATFDDEEARKSCEVSQEGNIGIIKIYDPRVFVQKGVQPTVFYGDVEFSRFDMTFENVTFT